MVFQRVAEQTISISKTAPSLANMKLSLTGKIFPVLTQFILTPDKAATVVAALQSHVEWEDLLIILYFGWTTVPLAHLLHEFLLKNKNTKAMNNNKDFEDTWLYCIATLFSQAVRVSLLVFLADCVTICLMALGFDVAKTYDFGSITARLVYTIWIAIKLANAKTYLISRAVAAGASTTTTSTTSSDHPMGNVAVMDNLLNLVFMVITLLFLSDVFHVNLGSGFASICALGGMQALVISVASKDLMEQFLSGIFLQVSDKFYEGDLIALADKSVVGVVTKIGWMHTLVRAADETLMRIPNKHLADVRVTNLTRCRQCQVLINLYVSIEQSIQQLQTLMDDIKTEIATACGDDLITDGSRPWRVHWTSIQPDGRCEIMVDAHFNLPPHGNVYFANKERVMKAIGRALLTNRIPLKMPLQEMHVHGSDGGSSSNSTSLMPLSSKAPICKNTFMVWDGIMTITSSLEDMNCVLECSWNGTVFMHEHAPDALKINDPPRNAFKLACSSDQEFSVTGIAKPVDGVHDGNKFKKYQVSFVGGDGWDFDGSKHVDMQHFVLTSLQWQGSPDATKSLVFAQGHDEYGKFVSVGWMRPGNRITLARRYLDPSDGRIGWDINKLRQEVIDLIWDEEEEECVIPPWQCTALNATDSKYIHV